MGQPSPENPADLLSDIENGIAGKHLIQWAMNSLQAGSEFLTKVSLHVGRHWRETVSIKMNGQKLYTQLFTEFIAIESNKRNL